jgi:hypothetical protein
MRYLAISLAILTAVSCNTGSVRNEPQPNRDSLAAALTRQKEEQDNLLQHKRLRAIMDERNNIAINVTTDEPVFQSRLFGGFKDIRFRLFNRYNYTLEQAILKVHYIKANGKEVKTETLLLKNISPNSARELTAPDYTAGGKTLEVTIETVLCRAINLCYYRDAKSTVPDPYKCE